MGRRIPPSRCDERLPVFDVVDSVDFGLPAFAEATTDEQRRKTEYQIDHPP